MLLALGAPPPRPSYQRSRRRTQSVARGSGISVIPNRNFAGRGSRNWIIKKCRRCQHVLLPGRLGPRSSAPTFGSDRHLASSDSPGSTPGASRVLVPRTNNLPVQLPAAPSALHTPGPVGCACDRTLMRRRVRASTIAPRRLPFRPEVAESTMGSLQRAPLPARPSLGRSVYGPDFRSASRAS